MASSALQGYLQDLKLLTLEDDPGWLAELYRWPASRIAANLCDLLDLAPGVLEDARDRQLRQSGLFEDAARCAEDLPAEVDLTPLEPLADGPGSQNVHRTRRRSGSMPAAPVPSETVQPPAASAAPRPASPATTTAPAGQPQHKRQWLPGRGWITRKVRPDEHQQHG